MQSKAATILGFSLMLGLAALGFLVQQMAVKFKEYERVVNVKGLAEQEVAADTVIWPIQFTVADNQLGSLFETLEQQSGLITAFLQQGGVEASAISRAAPNVIDKKAQQYGEGDRAEFRYIASQTLTVYSKDVAKIRGLISAIGFDPVDVGALRIARYIEPFGMLSGVLAYETDQGPEWAYRFAKFDRLFGLSSSSR